MKKIQVGGHRRGQPHYALVDDEDYQELSEYKWYYKEGYAQRHEGKERIYMHRTVNETPESMFTDHINRDKLDNRKSNLRTVTKSENERNTGPRRTNKSGIKGVSFYAPMNRWRANIYIAPKQLHLGYFKTADEAMEARKLAEKVYHV